MVKPGLQSVQARTDCALFRLEKREFDYLRKNLHPAAYKVARRIAMTVCERIRETNREIQSQLSGDIETELLPSKHSQANQSLNLVVLNRRKVFWVDWPFGGLNVGVRRAITKPIPLQRTDPKGIRGPGRSYSST